MHKVKISPDLELIRKILTEYTNGLEKVLLRSPAKAIGNIHNVLQSTLNHPGIKNFICTGNILEGALLKLRSCGLDQYFKSSDYFCAESLGDRSQIVNKCLQINSIPKEAAWVIGDTRHDFDGAIANGINIALVEEIKFLPINTKPSTKVQVLKPNWDFRDLLETISR